MRECLKTTGLDLLWTMNTKKRRKSTSWNILSTKSIYYLLGIKNIFVSVHTNFAV
jgi:hypothetical protein